MWTKIKKNLNRKFVLSNKRIMTKKIICHQKLFQIILFPQPTKCFQQSVFNQKNFNGKYLFTKNDEAEHPIWVITIINEFKFKWDWHYC
jgi:hypothetical protein